MSKANTLQKPATDETSKAATNQDSTVPQPYILLKTATANKLGKNSAGGIAYRVLADTDRKNLYITITGNDGGGYFSREVVPFSQVEKCLTDWPDAGKALPSKLFKTAFVGRSSNNAGFLAAILRAEDLLTAAPDAETQHVRHGDMATWKAELLTETGTQITLPDMTNSCAVVDGGPDETANKTLSLPRKKA
ncbi:hypothetical protein ACFFKC_08560 [Pseudoduganella danionis]|uniref:SH3 domain-containing protein n=1 Tax=Pseudoduganella danionis TaxID=1890295 RepID=A0ABW9SRT8_9BURK|nr:hypothetical protein [Pseudoduganella danionis]MTW34871.1 hypothetical protein [Pseudoduganella danionis]